MLNFARRVSVFPPLLTIFHNISEVYLAVLDIFCGVIDAWDGIHSRMLIFPKYTKPSSMILLEDAVR